MLLLLFAGYLVALAVIAVVDLRTLRAPNRLVYPLLALSVLASLMLDRGLSIEALLGLLLAFGVLLVVALVGRGAMGFGDVKYGALCGVTVGVNGVIPMLGFTFLAGGTVALVVLGLGIRRRTDVVAFTPFLFVGVLFSALWTPTYLLASAT